MVGEIVKKTSQMKAQQKGREQSCLKLDFNAFNVRKTMEATESYVVRIAGMLVVYCGKMVCLIQKNITCR